MEIRSSERNRLREAEFLTAERERGRQAIEQVMQRSYATDVDSVPVSFILIDPDRQMAFPAGDAHYAFICDVATRKDRRREGHFGAIVEHTFSSLRAAGIPLVITHGRYPLYRHFGFDVFTHHCGILVTGEQIERTLGAAAEPAQSLLTIEEGQHLCDDLLLITDVKARSFPACKAALQAAAAIAGQRGKRRILFEHPAAPSYGSRYPIYPSPETPLTTLARACGAQVRVQGADPESGPIPDADWIKVLDAAAFVRDALDCLDLPGTLLPQGRVCLHTDAGRVTIESTGEGNVKCQTSGVKRQAPNVKRQIRRA